MDGIFLVSYKVKGIKSLDEEVSLSFYKKTITLPINFEDYNIKVIYGVNGSGKSGIVASVDILRNLIIDETYLNNPMIRKSLDAIINKELKELCIKTKFLFSFGKEVLLYKYKIVLKKSNTGEFVIAKEKLSYKYATSGKEGFIILFETKDGEIAKLHEDEEDGLKDSLIKKTMNLLSNSTISALFRKKVFSADEINNDEASRLYTSILTLFLFGKRIYVYMDQSDDHTSYFVNDMLSYSLEADNNDSKNQKLYIVLIVMNIIQNLKMKTFLRK